MTYAQAAKLQPNEIVLLKSNGAQFKVKSIEFDPDNKIVFIRDSDDKMHHCSELEFPKTSTGRKNSVYVRTLIAKVINASEADNWENAVQEWAIAGCIEDKSKSHSCICGKEELVYLFTIRNEINGNILFPIGSSCIKKFEREDLSEQAALHEQMFKLYHAVESGRFISLNSEYFSRKVLKHLYDVGAFNTKHNRFNGTVDYEFMLKMFNKRDKKGITEVQHRKIRAIIVASIKPYLEKTLQDKVTPA